MPGCVSCFVFCLVGEGRGLAVCCKPELQMVLERRKKEQTQREEGEQCRSPLEQVLLQRQQKQQEVMVSTTLSPRSKLWDGECYYRTVWDYTYYTYISKSVLWLYYIQVYIQEMLFPGAASSLK